MALVAVPLDFFGNTTVAVAVAVAVVVPLALGDDGGTMMPMGRVKGIVMDS